MSTRGLLRLGAGVLVCAFAGVITGGCVTYVDEPHRHGYQQGYYDKYGHWHVYENYHAYHNWDHDKYRRGDHDWDDRKHDRDRDHDYDHH